MTKLPAITQHAQINGDYVYKNSFNSVVLTGKSYDFNNVVSLDVVIEDLLLFMSDVYLLLSAHRDSEVNEVKATFESNENRC